MRFQTPLIPARLIRRYKRFLADCRLEDGREITAHVANPGSMIGMADPDLPIWLEPNDDPKKKLDYAWRLACVEGATVGVDTGAANRVVRAALQAGEIPELDRYPEIRPEMRYTMGSRIDFLLSGDGTRDVYLEVKTVTLSRTQGLAEFPDSVTARGLKHLRALSAMAVEGHRAILFYVIMRDDCTSLRLAGDLDPAYTAGMADALTKGVEVMAMDCTLSPDGIALRKTVPLDIRQFGAADRLIRSG